MTTQFNESYNEAYPFAGDCGNAILAASTALTYTVPGDPKISYRAKVSVETSVDVWVRLNATAVVPTSNTMATTANQERVDSNFNRFVKGGDTLSFISTGTPQVGVSLLQLPYAS